MPGFLLNLNKEQTTKLARNISIKNFESFHTDLKYLGAGLQKNLESFFTGLGKKTIPFFRFIAPDIDHFCKGLGSQNESLGEAIRPHAIPVGVILQPYAVLLIKGLGTNKEAFLKGLGPKKLRFFNALGNQRRHFDKSTIMSVKSKTEQTTCPFCKDELEGPINTCPKCKTKYHKDCSEYYKKCATLGCTHKF